MKFNKIILIGLLALMLVSLSAVSAADDLNSTDDVTLTVQSADVSDDLTISDCGINEIPQVNTEILKGESNSIVITNETFSNYFDSEGRILDSVIEGSTLDFQGSIVASDNIKAIYINKSVNIISSTKDATITLNSVNGTLGIEHIANRFIVCNASSLTIKDVVFNRTQMLIYDSSNVILNNIGVISDNYNLCQFLNANDCKTTSFLKINNVKGFTLKNSYFHVFNTAGTVIICDETKEVLFDNNTFSAYGDSNYNNKSISYIILFSEMNTSFNFTNNNVITNSTPIAEILASNILFENNTLKQPSQDFKRYVQFVLGVLGVSNSIIKNNVMLSFNVRGNSIVYNNTNGSIIVDTALVYNNTIEYLTVDDDCVAYNNRIEGTVTIRGDNIILKDSTVGSLYCHDNSKNVTLDNNEIHEGFNFYALDSFILNNRIYGGVSLSDYHGNCEVINNIIEGPLSVGGRLNMIRNNVVIALSSNYAVSIARGTAYLNNDISNNKLYSKLYCGDDAVFFDEKWGVNYVYDNTPNQKDIYLNTSVDSFGYDENTTVLVNMPNVNGNATVDVDGQKYDVKLVNGTASLVVTKYVLGVNNVTVIYDDSENDIWAINHTTFTVNKVICPVNLIYDYNVAEGKTSYVRFILPEDANGTIFASLTNGVYNLDITQVANGGENKIVIPGLFEGNHTILATFTSVKYLTNSTSGNFTVVHVPVYQLTASGVVMDYDDGSKYKVLVIKDGMAAGAGEVVKITFNGVTKDVKTDKEGYATLTLDAAPKTYTIKAEYNGVVKSTKVTIKNILKASNISKKKAKNIRFQATLKNSKGKAIVGKKITFKFKGKTYSAKTNKKGIATITLKNLKVGKYAITSKYGACTVKNTIKIKK